MWNNAIAYGRITYKDKFIWPLPPFFNLTKDSYENIEFLFFMMVNMISKYVRINCWEKEWQEAKIYEWTDIGDFAADEK